MLCHRKIGFIGAGNMAKAMLYGLLSSADMVPSFVTISAAHEKSLESLKPLGVCTTTDNGCVLRNSDIVVLAVKPQQVSSALEGLADYAAEKCIISMVAGLSSARLSAVLPKAIIIRTMPNTPMLLGKGAIGASFPETVSEELRADVMELLALRSEVCIVHEDELNTVTALSGSGPAYFYRLANVMSEYAEKNGTDRETAMKLIIKTMEGAAEMLRSSGKTPEELIRAVSSPGGTTLAALAAFDNAKLDEAFIAGLEACAKRSKELSSF